METETTDQRPEPRLQPAAEWCRERGEVAALTVFWNPANASTSRLTEAELRSVVQQAYDRFGILAEPSYGAEAERTPAEVVLSEQYGPLVKYGPLDAAHNAGVRA